MIRVFLAEHVRRGSTSGEGSDECNDSRRIHEWMQSDSIIQREVILTLIGHLSNYTRESEKRGGRMEKRRMVK